MILVLGVAAVLPPLLYHTRVSGAKTIEPAAALSMGPVMEWLATVTAFFIKPLYMALSLLLAWFLRRRREADLSALKWAMIFFFAGELFCAFNYLFFNEGSYPAEHLHMFGMALAFGLTILAAAEFMDGRIIHFGAEARNCSLLAACGKCYKDAPVACSLRMVFIIVLPCLALLCAMPPLVPVRFAAQGNVILGTPYTYAHPTLYQLFETRYSPLLAALFFTTALLAFLLRRERAWSTAKLFFAGGAGFLSFAFFRLVLFSLFRERLYWFVIWEEWTEMMFIAALWLFILLFRKKPLLAAPQP